MYNAMILSAHIIFLIFKRASIIYPSNYINKSTILSVTFFRFFIQ